MYYVDYKKGLNTEFDHGIMIREEDNVRDTRLYVKSNIGPTRRTDFQNEWGLCHHLPGSPIWPVNVKQGSVC